MVAGMTERATHRSFLVRIYRFDPADGGTLTGLVEAIDGSGVTRPFASTEELGKIMRSCCAGEHLPGQPGGAEESGSGAS